jgi:hypothetical protein
MAPFVEFELAIWWNVAQIDCKVLIGECVAKVEKKGTLFYVQNTQPLLKLFKVVFFEFANKFCQEEFECSHEMETHNTTLKFLVKVFVYIQHQ